MVTFLKGESLCLPSVSPLDRQCSDALLKGERILLTHCIFMKEG